MPLHISEREDRVAGKPSVEKTSYLSSNSENIDPLRSGVIIAEKLTCEEDHSLRIGIVQQYKSVLAQMGE